MDDESLKWRMTEEQKLLSTAVFDVIKQKETAQGGLSGDYIALEAPDCVVVIPEYEGSFVLVRQWRHGASKLTAEFPGGVIGRGEAPETAAYRELFEETGFKAGRLTELSCVSPNPALFRSRFYVFLAEELIPTGKLHPDSDELIACELRSVEEVIASFGNEELCHAFMGTSLALYMRHRHYGPTR